MPEGSADRQLTARSLQAVGRFSQGNVRCHFVRSHFEASWTKLPRERQAAFRAVVLEAFEPDLMTPDGPFQHYCGSDRWLGTPAMAPNASLELVIKVDCMEMIKVSK